jgi:hypothetical protein
MNSSGTNMPDDAHVFRMTDDTGIFQHAKYTVPDPSHGYTTDDNARALIMATQMHETFECPKYLDLVYRYMQFLLYAWDGNWFRNFMGYDRKFLEQKGSEDCFGRCIWSLGYAKASRSLPSGLRTTADWLLRAATERCRELRYIRGKSYALLGLCRWGNPDVEDIIRGLATDITIVFDQNSGHGWHWFEERITYCNAIIPFALLEASDAIAESCWRDIGLESLNFLLDATFRENTFYPVGCNGWLEKTGHPAEYDQQPVEACETLLTCVKAYEITGDSKYLDRAQSCLAWYTGKNSLGISLIDKDTGGCMDGITPTGPNQNEGAESLISWWLALLSWKKTTSTYERSSKEWIELIKYLKNTISVEFMEKS